MLRFITAIFLLFAFTAQTFQRTVIVFDYYLNNAAYIKLCENKAKPALHCKGGCQMAKKLKAEEKQEKQSDNRKAEIKAEVFSAKNYFGSNAALPNFFKTPYQMAGDTGTCIDRSLAVFHPPSFKLQSFEII